MNYFLVIFIVISLLSSCSTTTIYLVRHAEKTDNSRDPDLSTAGVMRASHLAKKLQHQHIRMIFSTHYRRTIQTGKPLSEITRCDIQFYSPDTLEGFATRIKSLSLNTLVIGHSNTTLSLLDALGLLHKVKVINDNDYTNLFKITKRGKDKMKLEELKF